MKEDGSSGAEMNVSSMKPLPMLSTSVLDQSTSPDDRKQMTSVSAYRYHEVTYLLWMIVPPVLLLLGSYGSVMTIVVMRAMRASESTGCLSMYFTALAVSDLCILWSNVLWFWPEIVLDFSLAYFHDLSCMVPYFVNSVSSMTSAWILVSMTCQRMTSVVLPHRVEVLCTERKGKNVTATILIIACATNLHIFSNFQFVYVEGHPLCVSTNKTIALIFGFTYLCLASVLPFIVLILANSVLIYGVVRSVRMSGKVAGRGDSQATSRLAPVSSMTTVLILTSAAFLVLTSPSCVLWVYFELIGYYEDKIDDAAVMGDLALLDTLGILLLISNCSINFYVYILGGKKFRLEAKRCLRLCFKSSE